MIDIPQENDCVGTKETVVQLRMRLHKRCILIPMSAIVVGKCDPTFTVMGFVFPYSQMHLLTVILFCDTNRHTFQTKSSIAKRLGNQILNLNISPKFVEMMMHSTV